MIFTYDITIASQMNGGQPVLGRATRALANDTTLLQPVKFLYYPQLAPLEETADDGLPIVFDDEVRYHAGLAGGDPVKLAAMFLEYAAVIKRVKAKAPSCPVSVYGLLPDYASQRGFDPAGWKAARKPITDLIDFAFADLGTGATPAAAFDGLLADLALIRAEFTLPIMVKISPEHCPDAEFKRRLIAVATHPLVSQVCVWMEGDANWEPPSPTLSGQYAQIAKQMARDYPGGTPLRRRSMDRVLDYLMDQIAARK